MSSLRTPPNAPYLRGLRTRAGRSAPLCGTAPNNFNGLRRFGLDCPESGPATRRRNAKLDGWRQAGHLFCHLETYCQWIDGACPPCPRLQHANYGATADRRLIAGSSRLKRENPRPGRMSQVALVLSAKEEEVPRREQKETAPRGAVLPPARDVITQRYAQRACDACGRCEPDDASCEPSHACDGPCRRPCGEDDAVSRNACDDAAWRSAWSSSPS